MLAPTLVRRLKYLEGISHINPFWVRDYKVVSPEALKGDWQQLSLEEGESIVETE